MNTCKFKRIVFVSLVLAISTSMAFAYPPDNAVVLYYKAALVYRVDDEMADMLSDLQKGEVELNEEIREFVNKSQNRRVIDTLLDACEVKNCDWGMNFSQGMEMDMPPLGQFRGLSKLIIADAKILEAQGDYEGALNRCMSLYKMARHINDRIYISNLVAISLNGVVNDYVIEIMSQMPQDAESLTRLQNQLIEIESIPLSIKPAVLGEREAMLIMMTSGQVADVARFVEDESVKEKLLSADEGFLERNREYFKNYYAKAIAAFDMSYVEGFAVFNDLIKTIEKDAGSNPDAVLTGFLAPAMSKMFSNTKRFETHSNAVRSAVGIFLVKARTGSLPDELPAGLPKDMFSGESFDYLKSDDGFILRCKQKNLSDKNAQLYEYEFKVKK